jgi:membrane AbrB-like protein
MKTTQRSLRSIATALALSLCGGYLFSLVKIPLPWMLGPLFLVGFAGINGIRVSDIRGGRQTGQLIVGCALGLYFTPEVSRQLLEFGGYIVLAAFLAIMIGGLGSLVVRRISGIDPVTAFFGSVPGGAAEMAVMAERAGARFDQVALCHSLRLLLVVSTVPIAVTLTGANGNSVYTPLTNAVVFMKTGMPNAWILGSLVASMGATISGVTLSAVPPILSVAAQVLIGCALGTRFKPSLRSESHRLIKGILAGASCTVLLSTLVGVLVAWLIDESIPAMVLATSPGGIAEMCLTAKILKLGVPLVTSFQVTRLAIVLTCSLPLWKFFMKLKARKSGDGQD